MNYLSDVGGSCGRWRWGSSRPPIPLSFWSVERETASWPHHDNHHGRHRHQQVLQQVLSAWLGPCLSLGLLLEKFLPVEFAPISLVLPVVKLSWTTSRRGLTGMKDMSLISPSCFCPSGKDPASTSLQTFVEPPTAWRDKCPSPVEVAVTVLSISIFLHFYIRKTS